VSFVVEPTSDQYFSTFVYFQVSIAVVLFKGINNGRRVIHCLSVNKLKFNIL